VTADAAGTPAVPTAVALPIAEEIQIDGRLTEEAWSRAEALRGFTQREPAEGQPESERTEVRVAYDQHALYVGARMFDSEPARIVRRLTRRDATATGDCIVLVLDPFHDHRSGVLLEVSAAGSRRDALLFDDTREDESWDGVWEASTAVDDQGWTAEIRVPFSQLRYTPGASGTWGFNVLRTVYRKNEEAWWSFVPLNDPRLVSGLGHLAGLDRVTSSRHLEVLPYASTRLEVDGFVPPGNPFTDGSRLFGGTGLDLKWGVTSSVTLDATVNPDFGQVEVDPAVVNLTAFETFYEERRPFFIEGAQLLTSLGRNGLVLYGRFGAQYPSLWYSRRIGRAPQGSADGMFTDEPGATTILGAAKLTGRTPSGWSFAFVDALTAEETARAATGTTITTTTVEPFTHYAAGRGSKSFGSRGSLGFLGTAVQRSIDTPELARLLPTQAYAAAIDGHAYFDAGRLWVGSGSLAASYVTGDAVALARLQRSSARYYQRPDAAHTRFDAAARSLAGWSGQFNVNRTRGSVLFDAAAWAVSPGFESNDLGYMPAADRVGAHVGFIWRKTQPDRWTRRRSLTLIKYLLWNFDHDLLADAYSVGGSATLPSYWDFFGEVWFQPAVQDDRLTRGGPMMRRIPYGEISAGFNTDHRKMVIVDVNASHGSNRRGGWRTNIAASLEVRPSPSLAFAIGPNVTHASTMAQYVKTVADPFAVETFDHRYVFGDIEQMEVAAPMRLSWTFTPRASLQVFVRPLIASGDYWGFKQLVAPRTFDFARFGSEIGTLQRDESGVYIVDPDGAGDAAAFWFLDPDFNYKTLQANAVFRWEWRMGSTFYAVWTQQRTDDANPGTFDARRDIAAMLKSPADNVFMLKMTYWLSR
jgi:hypothetical protein